MTLSKPKVPQLRATTQNSAASSKRLVKKKTSMLTRIEPPHVTMITEFQACSQEFRVDDIEENIDKFAEICAENRIFRHAWPGRKNAFQSKLTGKPSQLLLEDIKWRELYKNESNGQKHDG